MLFFLLGFLDDQLSLLYILFSLLSLVCYVLTVEFNCNSMSTIIVLFVSIVRVDQKKNSI